MSTSKVQEMEKHIKSTRPVKKKIGTKFIVPPGHMKASGAILCAVPIKNTVNREDRVDDLVALKSQIKDVLDVDGLLFCGASVNGSRSPFYDHHPVRWLKGIALRRNKVKE